MPSTIRLHRVLATSPEKVYRAFIEADAVAKWLPPNGFLCTVHHLEPKVGGTHRMSFRNFTTGKSHAFGGDYRELVPGERLRYTDTFDDPNLPGEMEVTVELKAVSVGTDLSIVQAGIPVIYTASEPNGPNGPIMDELLDAAPKAVYVGRKGEVSAWDNADFVKAVEATGRKTLIMAGVWTSVCVAFPALQAKADGYKVLSVMDASGDVSKLASDAAMLRMANAGIVPVTTNTILSETHRTWNRADAASWGALYSELVPHYRAVAESYKRAQEAAK